MTAEHRAVPREPIPAELTPGDLPVNDDTMLDLFRASVRDHGASPCLRYFGRDLSWADVDEISDAAAAGLAAAGLEPGSRMALLTQNVPQYVLSMLAAWKAGAVAVPINPMLRPSDVAFILNDSRAFALVGLDELLVPLDELGPGDVPDLGLVVTTTADEYAVDWPEAFPLEHPVVQRPTVSWARLLAAGARQPSDPELSADQPAVLTYTSGTTGPPKGAVNTHANVVFASRFYEAWAALSAGDVVLGVAPLFHITGLVAHIGPSVATGAALVLAYRFDVDLIGRVIEQYRPTFTIGSITVFIALMNDRRTAARDLSSLTTIYSGGAPIAPAIAQRFAEAFGITIHNIYGLTEATGPCLAVPRGARAPVDPRSGALSVGVPVCNTEVRIVAPDGTPVGPGEEGEVVMRGPQVIPRYWQRPDETASSIRDGWLHTGDVALTDADGWYYVVDRLKDQINASGFKVWPREVEDALVAHPEVVEAAVVGVPDTYRGETVKAFVVVAEGSQLTSEELIGFSRARLAAYKYPRIVEIVDELPHTASGKVMRRSLRGG